MHGIAFGGEQRGGWQADIAEADDADVIDKERMFAALLFTVRAELVEGLPRMDWY
jgi:hypothetical protein